MLAHGMLRCCPSGGTRMRPGWRSRRGFRAASPFRLSPDRQLSLRPPHSAPSRRPPRRAPSPSVTPPDTSRSPPFLLITPAGAQSRVDSTHLRGRRPNHSAPPGGGPQSCGPRGPAVVLSGPGQPWVPRGRLPAVAGVVGGVDPTSRHLLNALEEVAHVRAAEALGPPRCEAVGRPRV